MTYQFCVGLLSAGLAVAPAMAMEPTMPRSPVAFDKLDANKDGRITVAELQPKAEARVLRLDADKDGQVSAAEIDQALLKAVQLRRDRLLKRLDGDANGSISRAEVDAYVELLLKTADVDADGGVTLEEAKRFRVAKLAR